MSTVSSVSAFTVITPFFPSPNTTLASIPLYRTLIRPYIPLTLWIISSTIFLLVDQCWRSCILMIVVSKPNFCLSQLINIINFPQFPHDNFQPSSELIHPILCHPCFPSCSSMFVDCTGMIECDSLAQQSSQIPA